MRVSSAFQKFFALDSAGGIILIVAATASLAIANSPLFPFVSLFQTYSFKTGVNDILMVFFFLLVGLELKREMVKGVLANRDQIVLPLFAAAAGMAVPALIFWSLNAPYAKFWNGWAIPTATDIAFASAILTLVARGTPRSIKIFLLAIAVFDDLGAILIIGLFYGNGFHLPALGLVGLGIGGLWLLNRLRISHPFAYIITGVYLWFSLHAAGIHTTIAGVLVGLFLPIAQEAAESPVDQWITKLHPWVAFLIMPLFGFVNCGVRLIGTPVNTLVNPLSVGIALGLFIGKQLGIFGMTWTIIRTGWVKMPRGASWGQIYGTSVIAGIGFTVSLFIGALAFPESMQTPVKVGVVGGSALSALWGLIVMKLIQLRARPVAD